jgi:N-methylhydantoinase A
MLVADLRRDFVHTWFKPLADASFAEMEAIFSDMEARGRETVTRRQGLSDTVATRAADMRYVGQEHAVTVDLPLDLFARQDRDGIKRRFDAVHQVRYGFSVPQEKAEIVSLRSAVVGALRKPPFEPIGRGGAEPERDAFRGRRPVYFASTGFVDAPTFHRPALKAGNVIAGPALIEEHASTTVLHPGDRMAVDDFGDLVIETRRP